MVVIRRLRLGRGNVFVIHVTVGSKLTHTLSCSLVLTHCFTLSEQNEPRRSPQDADQGRHARDLEHAMHVLVEEQVEILEPGLKDNVSKKSAD